MNGMGTVDPVRQGSAPYTSIFRAMSSIPRWVRYAAIGQFILLAVGGGVLMTLTIVGALPLGNYAKHITEQGDIAGYVILWFAVLWFATCLLSAGLGGTRMQGGYLLVGRAIWVWLFVVAVPCLAIGYAREADVLRDLQVGAATIRGTVTSAYSEDSQGTDSHGNSYTITTDYLSIGGLSFNSDASDMGDTFTRVPQGHCGIATYGRYSHLLTDLMPCPAG